MAETMARRLYDRLDLQTIAFAIVDPVSRQSAKVEHANQYVKRYRFPDGSFFRVHRGDKNFRWFVSIIDAVKGVGYIGPDCPRIDDTVLRSIDKYPQVTKG